MNAIPTPQSFLFDGEWVTAKELSKRLTAYPVRWLREALQEGCQNMADIVARDCRLRASRHNGSIKGGRKTKQADPRHGMACHTTKTQDTLRGWNPGRFAKVEKYKDTP